MSHAMVMNEMNGIWDTKTLPGKQESWWTSFVLPALALSFVVILTYAPVFAVSYGFYDDYSNLQSALKARGSFWALTISCGRPVLALVSQLFFAHAGTVPNLCWLRACGVVCLASLCIMVYVALRRARFSRTLSSALAFIVVTMPPFQVFSAWTSTFSYTSASVAAGGCAMLLLNSNAGRHAGTYWRFALAGLLLVLAMLIYQPGAMFLWFFVAICAATSKEDTRVLVKRLIPLGLVTMLSCIAGYAALKIGVATYGAISEERNGITSDLPGKLIWFLKEPLKNALNLNSIHPHRWRAVYSGTLIITGLSLYIDGSLKRKLTTLGILLLLVPLSYLPNLMVTENWASYRTQIALTPLIALYMFLALHGLVNKIGIGSSKLRRCAFAAGTFAWALASGLLASHNVTKYFVEPQSVEYRLVKNLLRKIGPNVSHTIWFIGIDWKDGLTPLIRYDEFGMPTSCKPWVAEGMVKCALEELGRQSDGMTVVPVGPDTAGQVPPDAAVVDMRLLKEFR